MWSLQRSKRMKTRLSLLLALVVSLSLLPSLTPPSLLPIAKASVESEKSSVTGMVTILPPNKALLGNPLTFTLVVSPSVYGSFAYVKWDFGDGKVTQVAQPQMQVEHYYAWADEFEVKATLLNEKREPIAGGSATTTATVEDGLVLKNESPLVVGKDVTFNVQVTDLITTYKYLTWDFGDGSAVKQTTEQEIVHKYPKTGAFLVRVTLFDLYEKPLTTANKSVTVVAGCEDKYEPNNTSDGAGSFVVGETQQHTFCVKGDEDWVSFKAEAGKYYRIETFEVSPQGRNKTYLYLYDTDGKTPLAFNSEGNKERYGHGASRITKKVLSAGTYYVRVRNGNEQKAGPEFRYTLKITDYSAKSSSSSGGTITISSTTNLFIRKSVWPPRPVAGGIAYYYIYFGNDNSDDSSDANGIIIRGKLPKFLKFITSKLILMDGTVIKVIPKWEGDKIKWVLERPLPRGSYGRIVIEVRVSVDLKPGDRLDSPFEIGDENGFFESEGSTSQTEIIVQAATADPGISKYVAQKARIVAPGDEMNYALYYWNNGTLPISNVQIVDTLPEGAVLAWGKAGWKFGSTKAGTPQIVGNKITWTIDWLGGYGGGYLKLRTHAKDYLLDGDTIVNQATISASADTSKTNNSTSVKSVVNLPTQITGMVFAPDGTTPLKSVHVYAYTNLNGEWKKAAHTLTKKDGSYVLRNLSPNTYLIAFQDKKHAKGRPYPDEYYLNAATSEEATYVTVQKGETKEGIDATLDKPVAPLAIVVGGQGSLTRTNPRTGEVEVRVSRGKGLNDLTISRAVSCASGALPSQVILQLVGKQIKSFTMNQNGVYAPYLAATQVMTYELTLPAAQLDTGELMIVATCEAGIEEKALGKLVLYDPSGIISDAVTGQPIEGATVTLYKVPEWTAKTNPQDVTINSCESNLSKDPGVAWSQPAPTELGEVADPSDGEIDPTSNPQTTDGIGYYGWDVAAGCWYVEAEAEGYESKVSAVVGVPPAVTDLHLALSPIGVRFSDEEPGVDQNDSSFTASEADGQATVTVILNTPLANNVTVSYATSDGTAVANKDYTPSSGKLTFAAGVVTQTFTVDLLNNNLADGNRTIKLNLSNPSSTNLSSPSAAVLTILDDEPPLVQFSAASYQVSEDAVNAPITVTLSAAQQQQVSVQYAFGESSETATPGTDYTATKGTLSFAPGETTKTINVPIIDDSTLELTETVSLHLSAPSNATLGPQASATLTILDNEKGSLQANNIVYFPLIVKGNYLDSFGRTAPLE